MTRRTEAQLAEIAEARLRKERARLKTDQVRLRRQLINGRRAMLSVHRAAEKNRLTKDWRAPATSADSEIIADLPLTTARARQLVRDDPYAKSTVRSFRRNLVGTGITPSLDAKAYKRAFKKWADDPRQCDIEGKRTFWQIQRWAAGEMPTAGEAFIIRWIVGGRLMLQCVESEQLDLHKLTERSTDNDVIGGVEVDANGAPVAYHIYRDHPHAIRGLRRPMPLSLETMRVPASMVCHLYDPDRVLQTRGISWFAPALRKARDLTEYDAAQLRVARAQAGIGLLIKGTSMDENGNPDDPLELDGLNVGYLNDDEDVTPFTPTRPGGEYEPFIRAQLKAMAAGTGISYDQIARDFDQGTFSSKRMAALEDHREWEPLIMMIFVPHLCQPVLRDFVHLWAMANPVLAGDYFVNDDSDLAEANWQGQGWDWVDPEAMGKSVERKYRLGLTTRTREANKLGVTVSELDREAASDGTQQIVDRLMQQGGGDGREMPAPDSVGGEPIDITSDDFAREEVVDAVT